MSSNDAPQPSGSYLSASNSRPPPRAHFCVHCAYPTWRKYVHLYTPMITGIAVIIFAPTIIQGLNLNSAEQVGAFVAFSAIPTYLIGSLFYRPDPTAEESIRFTRKNDLYRAGVIATYGRWYGTPFNILFYIMDVFFSFAADNVIGERPAGTIQRHSEFLVALMWVFGSMTVRVIIPVDTPILGLLLGMADRTLWRTAYVALVDDVVGVLTRPNIRTLRGKATVVLVQGFMIFTAMLAVAFWVKRQEGMTAGDILDLWELEGKSPVLQRDHK